MKQRQLFLKLFILGALLGLFALGLSFVNYIVYEREGYQNQVVREIERNQIDSQRLVSPFITVPYTQMVACDYRENPALKDKLCAESGEQLFFPEQIDWDAKFDVSDEKYRRTIYAATSYMATLKSQGKFRHVNEQVVTANQRTLDWQSARFVLPIKDLRGVHQKPILTIGGEKRQLDFSEYQQTGSGGGISYLSVALPNFSLNDFDFTLDMSLEGLQVFSLVPTTEKTTFKATGNWADAKYFGDSLPTQNSSFDQQFSAKWQSITLGYQNRQDYMRCWNAMNCSQYNHQSSDYYEVKKGEVLSKASGFAVEFIEPVNVYSQTDRAIKYGWMITLITFASFFLFESLKGLAIHPIQYLLVGIAQSVFFLLLLSFSEQYSFLSAYYIAAIACIGLIGWYLRFVMGKWLHAILFSVLLGSLYVVMYVLLQSAEKTFFMGSIFAFVLVAAVMFITRNVDWYQMRLKNPTSNG